MTKDHESNFELPRIRADCVVSELKAEIIPELLCYVCLLMFFVFNDFVDSISCQQAYNCVFEK